MRLLTSFVLLFSLVTIGCHLKCVTDAYTKLVKFLKQLQPDVFTFVPKKLLPLSFTPASPNKSRSKMFVLVARLVSF